MLLGAICCGVIVGRDLHPGSPVSPVHPHTLELLHEGHCDGEVPLVDLLHPKVDAIVCDPAVFG